MNEVLPRGQDVGDCGGIWRKTCDQFWGSLKKTAPPDKRGLLRTKKAGKEVAQQMVNVKTGALARRSNLSLIGNP